ncbi:MULTISPECIES: LuxR C-terminal-related transcriptional regulator [unclassified Streptomyces]|uniref:LuxR C-terminal-related transcriptional regulator n=1 Tax=unclassified Streptomyces TaxID=2593676 RepID=UPI00278C05D6|nr:MULTISPECIES: LuxR C-terminal-related transcriptional regulator [unclassified Streptomyces]
MDARAVAVELPAETTSFVGRGRELRLITEALTRVRLVTLTGPGGVGKTRTAVRAAREQAAEHPGGVHLVPLSGLSAPELLPHTVCAALGLSEQGASDALQALCAHLAERRALLVLDTCEHLIDACAALADTLLHAAPALRVIATSRQPLDIPGEQVLPIPPLPVPDAGTDAGTGAGADGGGPCEAVTLFVDRAAAAAPGFVLTDANRGAVHDLCRCLDGIPLAVELAVARLRVLGPDQLLRRIDQRLRLLTGGRRVSVPRHQTLRATIAWSHDLCTVRERLLWARLSVFVGGFTLEAAEDVCADEAELPADDVLDCLAGLVDKSVVQRVEADDEHPEPRYRMLDTLREFGLDHLGADDEEHAARARHLAYYLRLAEEYDHEWTGDGQLPWLRRLVDEHGNLRAALEFAAATPGEEQSLLTLTVRLWGYWNCAGLLTQGRHWLARALAVAPKATTERVRALWITGTYMNLQGDTDDHSALYDEAETVAASLGDRGGVAWARAARAMNTYFLGELDGVTEEFDEALRVFDELGDRPGQLMAPFVAAPPHILTGNPQRGIALCDRSLERDAATPDECWARGWALWTKSIGLWFADDHVASAECAREGIRVKAALGDSMGIAHFLENLAWRAAELGGASRVAVLHGAADRLWRLAASAPRFSMEVYDTLHDAAAESSRRALGEHEFQRRFREGEALTTQDAVRWALTDELPRGVTVPQQREDPDGPAGLEALTAREREVAALVAEGLTNREIAERLVISKRTADAHVEHILSKLGFSSRSAVATLYEPEQPTQSTPPAAGEHNSSPSGGG